MSAPRHRRPLRLGPRLLALCAALAVLWLADWMLRAIGEAAHHDNWDSGGIRRGT